MEYVVNSLCIYLIYIKDHQTSLSGVDDLKKSKYVVQYILNISGKPHVIDWIVCMMMQELQCDGIPLRSLVIQP